MGKPDKKLRVFVTFDLEVSVELPGDEAIIDGEGQPTEQAYRRAVEAALAAFTEKMEVFIDGEDKKPAVVWNEASDNDVTDVRVE